MPVDMIHVQPARGRRQEFARWATRQRPKIRTVGIHVFAVPPDLFVAAPEAVLIGSLIDGQRYVSPETSPPRPANAPTRRRPSSTKSSPKRPARVSPRPDAGTTVIPAGFEGAPAGVTPPGGGRARGDGPPPGTSLSVSAPTRPAPGADTDTSPATASGQLDASASAPPDGVRHGQLDDAGHGQPDGDGSGPPDDSADAGDAWNCPACPRTFTTARGRAAHHRQAHTSGEG